MGNRNVPKKSWLETVNVEHVSKKGAAYVSLGWFAIVFVGIVALNVSSLDVSKTGQFGDSFGAINSLLQGLTLIGLVAAAVLQYQQLQLARTEAKNAERHREAEAAARHRDSVEAERARSADLERAHSDRVETTFFSMMEAHDRIVDRIVTKGRGDVYSGKTAMDYLVANHLYSLFDLDESSVRSILKSDTQSPRHLESSPNIVIDYINFKYEIFYHNNRNNLGPYFRSLYRIVAFLDESNISAIDKYRMSKWLRAQLSEAEQILLFLNCLSKWGSQKMRPLVRNFSLLKHLEESAKSSHSPLSSQLDRAASFFGGSYAERVSAASKAK